MREGQSEAARQLGCIIRSDITVPISEIPSLLAEVESWRDGLPAGTIILPFGHVGDGNLHVNFVVPEDQVEAVREPLLERLYDTVDRLRGSISAEHGVGRAKLAAVWARKSAAFRELSVRIKQTLDPENRLNPGVAVPARRTTNEIRSLLRQSRRLGVHNAQAWRIFRNLRSRQ